MRDVNVRESEDAPPAIVRPRRTSPGSHPLKGFPCSALRRCIGAEFVAKSPPDGYTWLLGTSQHTVTPSIVKHVPYDIAADFAPVTLAVRAHIRHLHTEYDRLRDEGGNKRDSRAAVRETIDEVAARWRLG